jgi:hypothetical protein
MFIRHVTASLCIAALLGCTAPPPPVDPPTLKSMRLSCADFRHNPDGTWTPTHRIRDMTGMNWDSTTTLDSTTTAFDSGSVNIKTLLDSQCSK